MKIPTILGLALIIASISLGLILYSSQKITEDRLIKTQAPKNIKIVNLTSTQATIIWQTSLPTQGEVKLLDSPNNLRLDDRDINSSKPHLVHFVTIKNLSPDTKYNYQIKNGSFIYPEYSLEFKTIQALKADIKTPLQKTNLLRGTILNTNLNPIDEALVTLNIENPSLQIAGITGTAGNFILSLNTPLTLNTQATLLIEGSGLTSNIELTLPLQTQNLPPITIGQNFNLNDYLSTSLTPKNTQSLHIDTSIYDLNADGVLNSLDSAIISDNINRKNFNKQADLNNDGKVDQKDLTLILKSLE